MPERRKDGLSEEQRARVRRTIGIQTRRAMKARKWNEDRLGKELGISQQTVSNILKGKSSTVGERIFALCMVFNLPPAFFFYGLMDEDKPTPTEQVSFIDAVARRIAEEQGDEE